MKSPVFASYRDFRPVAPSARRFSLRISTSRSGASGIFLKADRERASMRPLVRASVPSASTSVLAPFNERSSSFAARRTSIWLRCLPRLIFFRLDLGHSPYTLRRSFTRLLCFFSGADLTLLMINEYAAICDYCREIAITLTTPRGATLSALGQPALAQPRM
jgi:hypothetical protein